MLMLLNSEDASTREFLLAKFDHSWAEWWEATAAAYNKYLRYLERERHELEGMLDPANRHAEALRLATMETQKMAANQAKLNDTMQDTQWTMQDVLDDMATGFETANKNIKEFTRRWDMLIGKAIDFNSLQREFEIGQGDLFEAFQHLQGTSLVSGSDAANEANEALEDQINLAGQFAAEIFGSTNDMEQAEAALNAYLDAIARVAAGTGVNMDEFRNIMASLQWSPESFDIITATGADPASGAGVVADN